MIVVYVLPKTCLPHHYHSGAQAYRQQAVSTVASMSRPNEQM